MANAPAPSRGGNGRPPQPLPVRRQAGRPESEAGPPAEEPVQQELKLPPGLEHYLPTDLWQKLAAGPPHRGLLLDTLERLRSILYLLSTYLPRHLVQAKLRRPVAGQVQGQMLHGSLLFADVSGFTALSERLAGLGEEGTERLTGTMNAYFEEMVDILSRSGGILLKFAGDALLVYFPERKGGEQARWAVRAARRMMGAMDRFAGLPTEDPPSGRVAGEPIGLRMKIGLSTGAFLAASVGSAQRMEYVVLGDTVARTLAAEGLGQAGQVIADEATAAHLAPGRYTARDGGFVAVDPAPDEELGTFEIGTGRRRARGGVAWNASPHALVAQMEVVLRQIKALAPYLADELVERIVFRAHRRQVESEHRRATVLFVNFTGLEPLLSSGDQKVARQVTGLLDDYFRAMHKIITRRGGIVSRIDPYSQGSKMLILFGAPVGLEEQSLRAVSAALAMNDELAQLNERWRRQGAGLAIEQRLGITRGDTFAGQAGAATRREYTVMGDDVNLAARLMSAAQAGQILLSQRVYDEVVEHFAAEALPPLRVKGKSKPIPVYQPLGPRDDPLARRLQGRGPLVGRDRELDQAKGILRRTLAGEGTGLTLRGPAGAGKSRLADQLIAHALARRVQVSLALCRSFDVETPYAAWLVLLQNLLAVAGGRRLVEVLAHLGLPADEVGEPLANLLGLVLPPARQSQARPTPGPPTPKTGLFARLEQRAAAPRPETVDWRQLVRERKGAASGQMWQSLQARVTARQEERLFAAVTGLLARLADDGPLLLCLENAQWLDPASRALLGHLAEELSESAILFLVVERSEGQSVPPGVGQSLELGPLDFEATAALADYLLSGEGLDAQLVEAIYARSGGNPLFVEELANWLRRQAVTSAADLAEGLPASHTLHEWVLSRLDRLPLGQRDALQAGAVAGSEFLYGQVRALTPDTTAEASLRKDLSALQADRFIVLTRADDGGQYAFRQTLVREVGYRSLSLARRRELHGRLAAYLAALHDGRGLDLAQHSEVLAHHYELADQPLPAARYLLLSAQKAGQRYAYAQASGFLDRALDLVQGLPADRQGDVLARVHEARGDVALVAADFEAAAAAYQAARAGLEGAEVPTTLLLKLALLLPLRDRAGEALTSARRAWDRHEAGQALACAASLAWLLWRRGDGQAGDWVERARALVVPGAGRWQAGIAALLADLDGDWSGARQAYQALDRPAAAALAACRQGDVHLQARETDQALALYEQAAGQWQAEKDAAGLALARYRQAEAYLLTGDGPAAREALEEAGELLAAARSAAPEAGKTVRRALRRVEASEEGPWPPWRWQRYDDALRISLLFRPWWSVQAALPGDQAAESSEGR